MRSRRPFERNARCQRTSVRVLGVAATNPEEP
jgi:hypothetical protein